MRPLGPERDHYFLALAMAKAAGVDLQAAIDAGRFSQQRWARMVQTCRSCACGSGCANWLQESASIDEIPDACENSGVFRALRDAQREAEQCEGAD